MIKSNAKLSVIFLEIKALTFNSNYSWVLFVYLVNIMLEVFLSFDSGQIIRVLSGIFGPLNLLWSVYISVSLSEEISLPGLRVPKTVVEKRVKRKHDWKSWSFRSWSHIWEIVVVSKVSPLFQQSFIVSISLSFGFCSNIFRYIEASVSSFDLPESFSSSCLQDPVIRV